MVKLYFLLAIFQDGDQYVLRKHVDLNQCTQALIMERKAYLDVKEKFPEFTVTFKCLEEQ